jgi:sugar phosphate isomerase/epimerase
MNRRQFIQSSAMAAAALSLPAGCAKKPAAAARWPIGCFNRPWVNDQAGWTYDTALDGIKAAGYQLTGLLTRTQQEHFLDAEVSDDYLSGLKKKIADRGLRANMGALRVRTELLLDASIKDARRQVDHAHFLGLEFLLTFGVDSPQQYANYYRTMADIAAYSQERGLKLVLKPHGGGSGAAEEIVRCMKEVGHPNFKIWYDAGNIIYYTGKDPLEQLKPIAKFVTGFCAKDCDKEKGEVFLEFGKGRVDFHAVFGELKNAGFDGPVMVECCAKGATPDEVTANARKNREFLERVFAEI